jgi:hypothetical protein
VASIAGSAGGALDAAVGVGAGVGKGDGEALGVAVRVGEALGVAVAEACTTWPVVGLDEGPPVNMSDPKPIARTATSTTALRASAIPMMRSAERRCIGQSYAAFASGVVAP